MLKIVTVPVPVTPVGYSAPVRALLEVSDTVDPPLVEVDSILLADIGLIEAPQDLQWPVDLDDTKFYYLTLLSAINERSQSVRIRQQVAAGKVRVKVWTEDAIGKVVEGLIVRVIPTETPAEAGAITIVAEGREPTDAAGYVAVEINADSGSYNIIVANKAKPFDTAGKSGQELSWNDL